MKRLLIATFAIVALLASLLPAPHVSAASFDATITWADNSTNENGFKLYRKQGTGGTYAVVGQVGANVTTYTDLGLAIDTQYCYQVGAFNAVNELSGPEQCATTGAPVSGAPGAPTIIFIYKP